MFIVVILVLIIQMKPLVAIQIEFKMLENTKIGTVIANLFSELSSSNNKTKLDFIKNDIGSDNYFSLAKDTGDLIVSSQVDREVICEDKKDGDCVISLLVDSDTDMIQIRIRIEDVNDNSPVFLSLQKTIYIQENIPLGTTYFLPVAQDKDTYKYGVNNYSISGLRVIDTRNHENHAAKDRYFRIEGSVSPQLQVIGSIDREEITSFVFLLIASDFGHRTGSCTMTVVVTDVNDNSPEWKKDCFKVKIKECQVHGEILEFEATDKDDPNTANGRLTYRFSDRTKNRVKMSQIFYISGNKLYLSNNRPSELSNIEVLTLFVIAVDGHGRMKETSVEVTVEDCNDHPPTISIRKRYGQIMENVKEKLLLTNVNVKDNDRGRNGLFQCHLNDTSHLNLVKRFVDVSQNTIFYKIETNGDHAFDREQGSVYTIEIQCTDQGDPIMSSAQRFSINILDQNDNAPKFVDKMRVFHVTENNVIGSTIGHVKAVDPDSGVSGHVRYRVVGADEYFSIGIFGEIQSKVKFDREEKESYEFSLIALDNGNPSMNDTMEVKVIIGDVNDCKPIFNEEYSFKVTESYGSKFKNENIGKIRATDKDYGNNGTVYYKIVTMKTVPIQRIFRISADGVISIYGNLDREMIASIQLPVEAYDNGYPRLSSQTTVLIEIVDLNDNAPLFIFPNKTNEYLNISLDSELGTHVGTVSANDPDYDINGTIVYSFVELKHQLKSPLRLDSEGKIFVVSELKSVHTSRQWPQQYSIKAADNGSPPKYTIQILNINYHYSKRDQPNQISGRKSTENPSYNSVIKSNKRNKFNDNSQSNSAVSDSMMLLYCLAAILFFVFIIVFSVLLYIYCTRPFDNSERYSNKQYKSNNSPVSSNPNMKELQHMIRNPDEFQECLPCKNEDGAAVCFLNEDGSSYTHLMMLANNNYTPIMHSPISRTSYLNQVDHNQPELISVSRNFLDTMISNSNLEYSNPKLPKNPIQKFSVSNTINNSVPTNCPESYSTLHDKLSFSSLNRKQSIHTLPSSEKLQYAMDNSECTQPHNSCNSHYVTSSFV